MSEYTIDRGRKRFRFEFILSGDSEKDKVNLMLNFQKAVDAYFLGQKPKEQKWNQPDRY